MNLRRWIIGSTTLVITLWIASFLLLLVEQENRGVFGDMFGAVNALFSGLAFAGIIITILMQKQELELQRKELEETKEVFKNQSQIMANQQNDNTFFNLLSNHRQMVDSLKTGEIRKLGKRSLRSSNVTITDIVSGYEIIETVASSWIKHFTDYSNIFRTGIILEVDQSTIDPIEIMKSDTPILTLFNEVLHVYNFIGDRFKDDNNRKFYEDTLWNSLTYSEKFIFECLLFNLHDNQSEINHKIYIYNQYDFIDFNTQTLPRLEVKSRGNFNSPLEIVMAHNGRLTACSMIVFKENNKANEIEIQGVSKINIQDTNGYFGVDIINEIVRSNIGVESKQFSDYKL